MCVCVCACVPVCLRLTDVKVTSAGITLLVTLAAAQLHQLNMQLVENVAVQCIHCIDQLQSERGVKAQHCRAT